MAKRQQVTKLLAVMAMTASPALAGPGHGPGHRHGDSCGAQPEARRGAAPAASAAAAPAAAATVRAAPAAAPSRPAPSRPVAGPAPAGFLEAVMTQLGIARPRQLPDGSPAPGNVASRAARGRH